MNKPQGIYGILPSGLETKDLIKRAEAALMGGLRTVQLRDKGMPFSEKLARAKSLRGLTRIHGADMIINDDIRLAINSDADGTHVGRSDVDDWSLFRGQLGASRLLGVTCRKDIEFARHVLENGADYISIGAIYPTSSKPDAELVGIAALKRARKALGDTCIVAVGGIQATHIPALKAAGASAVAMISEVFSANDIEAHTRRLIEHWEAV